MSRGSLAFVVVLVCFIGDCSPRVDPRPAAQFSLQLATRQSCGVLSGLDYDTSCVAAVYVKAFDPSKVELFSECKVLAADDRSADMRALLSREEPLIAVRGLSATGVVTFEVRGFHDVGFTGDPCATPNDNRNWIFWGQSDPVDLATYNDSEGPPLLRVVLDCRDCSADVGGDEVFGCVGLNADEPDGGGPVDETCGPEFPASFCVPVVACAKGCTTDDDCFQGARTCVGNTCDTDTLTGELCSPCGDLIACGDNFVCVEKPGQDPFCAPACPGVDPCATGTKCNRLGNNLALEAAD